MAKFTTTQSFSDGDQVTSATLNAIVGGLAADSDLAADSTITVSGGAIKVGTIGTTNIAALAVTTARLAADAVDGTKIADDSIDSEHYVDGSIDEAHLATGAVTWAKTLSTDKAVQADMQSETASHFVSPDVLKYHPGVAKAYGVIGYETGDASVSGGYNIASAAETSSTSRTVTLDVTMADTNYTVTATSNLSGRWIYVTNKTTTSFVLNGALGAGAGGEINIQVFGQLA